MKFIGYLIGAMILLVFFVSLLFSIGMIVPVIIELFTGAITTKILAAWGLGILLAAITGSIIYAIHSDDK